MMTAVFECEDRRRERADMTACEVDGSNALHAHTLNFQKYNLELGDTLTSSAHPKATQPDLPQVLEKVLLFVVDHHLKNHGRLEVASCTLLGAK
jgi:hypothetical protein